MTEERISNIEGKIVEMIYSEQHRANWKMKQNKTKHKLNFSDFWDNSRRPNIYVIGVPEWEEKECGTENIFDKIMTETFLNSVRDKSTDLRNSVNSKEDKPKNFMTRNTRIKPMKTKIVILLFTSLIWSEIMLENNIILQYLVC